MKLEYNKLKLEHDKLKSEYNKLRWKFIDLEQKYQKLRDEFTHDKQEREVYRKCRNFVARFLYKLAQKLKFNNVLDFYEAYNLANNRKSSLTQELIKKIFCKLYKECFGNDTNRNH